MKKEKIKLLDINIFASMVFILTIIVSTTLTYNEKLVLSGEKPIFKKDEVKSITMVNRSVLLIIAVIYIYTSYREYKINQSSSDDNATKASFIQFLINDIQLITVIIITLLPMFYPEEDIEGTNILIP
ncbi:MAG: hypothetical protein PHW32_02180 [Bacilli bacterium]|nr:hypothetical protein [Bacilli bacterium]MDD4282942.1 hypothetical protein [Bacilli bacterium]MDD4718787.1 hypothetical protein [Bacilli bacterium]